jgi:hypothetical protein
MCFGLRLSGFCVLFSYYNAAPPLEVVLPHASVSIMKALSWGIQQEFRVTAQGAVFVVSRKV